MRKQKILALSLAATLMALPLAACGGNAHTVDLDGEKFVVTDYAVELDDTYSMEKNGMAIGELSMKELDFALQSISGGSGAGNPEVLLKNTGDGYQLYNMRTESLVSDTKWQSVSYAGSYSGGSPYLQLMTAESEYYYATPTGKLIGDQANYICNFETKDFVGAGGEEIVYYVLAYRTTVNPEDKKEVYWTYDNETKAWKELTAAEVNSEEGYKVGDSLGLTKKPLSDLVFGEGAEVPEGYKYADYKYSVETGNGATKYTFYNKDEKVGSTSVYGSDNLLGVIGKYLYFYDQEPVSSEALNGYNMEISSDGAVIKGNVTLYRYDFTEDDLSDVDRDWYYLPSTSYTSTSVLYNKTEKDADKMVVSAMRKTDGIVVANSLATTYRLIIDEDAKVSFDLTDKALGSDAKFYQLSETRFLSGKTILDENMETVAVLPTYNSSTAAVWEGQKLIAFPTSSSEALFVDYDGKVVIAGVQPSGTMVGDCFVGVNKDGQYMVYSKANPNGKTLDAVTNATEADSVDVYDEIALVKTTVGDTTTYTYYSFSGKTLGTTTNHYGSLNEICGKWYATSSSGTLIFA